MITYCDPGDQWDMTFITDLLNQVGHSEIDVFVIPGRYWYDKIEDINGLIGKSDSVLAIVCGDEEALFDTSLLVHPNMKIWLQSPHIKNPRKADRYFPIGYTPKTRETVKQTMKQNRWFFGGQVTHDRRKKCVKELKNMQGGILVETQAFNTGIDNKLYLDQLSNAMVAPCPSGAVIPDTFRMYEALEAGCMPIVDGVDPTGESKGYFNFLFDEPELPFPIIEWWEDLSGTVDYFCDTFPQGQNKAFAWWQLYKRNLKIALQEDINTISDIKILDTSTILIPTSPIAAHPDISTIKETIENTIYHFPNTEILVMIDGIRDEQAEYEDRYDQYINNLLWYISPLENVTPILFEEHQHQAKMTRETLKLVNTDLIMFIEHDTPLVTDYDIPFYDLENLLLDNKYDVIRLHHEAGIIPDHEHLMLDLTANSDRVMRTAQWSQRPHIARTEYYRQLLDLIPYDAHTMIEDAIHGITQEKYLLLGLPGWNQHRIAIYAPEGNMKRSYHLDGRGDDPKWT